MALHSIMDGYYIGAIGFALLSGAWELELIELFSLFSYVSIHLVVSVIV